MIATTLLALATIVAPVRSPNVGDPDPLVVTASLSRAALLPGVEHHLVVSFRLAEEWSARGLPLIGSVAPQPLLQLDVPRGVELTGPRADTPDEILRAAYVDLPYERVLYEAQTRIEFRVTAELEPDTTIEFNVLLYVLPPGEGRARAIRQRYRLPLEPGARAVRVPATASGWGRGSRLQLGDRLPDLRLPRVFGPECALAELTGGEKRSLVVMTYHSCL